MDLMINKLIELLQQSGADNSKIDKQTLLNFTMFQRITELTISLFRYDQRNISDAFI